MQTLAQAVGPGQPNARHDVALVQAALRLVDGPQGRPYLGGRIDGGYGPITEAAIGAFQADHGGDAVPIAPLVVTPGGHTQTSLARLLPADRRDLRVLSGQRVVYLGRPAADANAAAQAIRTDPNLRPAFRARVADLVQAMHRAHGLVLSTTPNGGRRSFAEQARIRPPQSYAGPGESNHNYGNAVDLGFDGTVWLRQDAAPRRDNHWLSALERQEAPAAAAMWDARDAIALRAPVGLFRLNFERIHLQDFNQATTSAGRSLAAHLTAVGAWNWQTARYDRAARDWHYTCDLGGTTGTFVAVGTADQVWAGTATVTAAEIQSAGWVRPGPLGGPAGMGRAATPPITPADIASVRASLQADFQAADRAWALWRSLP
ncbi:MAG: M15 family metallopeptidase [Kiloniellales bacterium]|nr:M15 family metallopeptidase [Kiloniellales bacterium]